MILRDLGNTSHVFLHEFGVDGRPVDGLDVLEVDGELAGLLIRYDMPMEVRCLVVLVPARVRRALEVGGLELARILLHNLIPWRLRALGKRRLLQQARMLVVIRTARDLRSREFEELAVVGVEPVDVQGAERDLLYDLLGLELVILPCSPPVLLLRLTLGHLDVVEFQLM